MTTDKPKLSDTLNLPQTTFPMKADLAHREPGILEKWEREQLYTQRTQLREGSSREDTFLLHDGPPYANGHIHIGHAVNKIMKDMVIRTQFLSGKHTPYIPGWDCHGLPIEINVEKKLGKVGSKKKDGSEVTAKEFRAACRAYAEEWVEIQKAEFKRLGILGDWEHPYKTMDPKIEAGIVRSLGKIVEKGDIAQGFKPVHWCFDCGSSLAEAEIEYDEKESPAIDVKFAVVDPLVVAKKFGCEHAGQGEVSIVIWTTTPWTLPMNRAVALGAEIEYALVEVVMPAQAGIQERWILAKDLVESCMARYGMTEYKILGTAEGKQLTEVVLQHPFLQRTVPLVLGHHVTADAGTGAVHIAPPHGEDDYRIGFEHFLQLDHYIQDNGTFKLGDKTPSSSPLTGGEQNVLSFDGLHIWKANPLIIDLLKQNEKLLCEKKLKHSYPHCWRHKTPVIFRATPQFFVTMDKLKEPVLTAIKQVSWHPAWGMERMQKMIENRPDWCISRQRTWGVPLPFVLKDKTFHAQDQKITEAADFIETKGMDAFDERPAPEGYEKVQGVPDVWFESGLTHDTVLAERGLPFPADLYLEGSDQYRGWFQSSLLTSVAINGCAPYKQIITHGFVVDAQGRKMSKSIGNVVAPEAVIKKYGADVLRLWVASTDYSGEMVISEEVLQRTADLYRRIRNTARFLLANTSDFNSDACHASEGCHPGKQKNYYQDLDAWALNKTMYYQNEIQKHYAKYDFVSAMQAIQQFCSVEMGGFYLDVIKDRLYTYPKNSPERNSAQKTLFHILEALVRWIAPVLAFTAEEIWQAMPQARPCDSVHLTGWQDFGSPRPSGHINWDEQIIPLRNAVNKQLEIARQAEKIGSALEAEVRLFVHDETLLTTLKQLGDDLRFVFITSSVSISTGDKADHSAVRSEEFSKVSIEVVKIDHEKCARCWHRCPDLQNYDADTEICQRCVMNLSDLSL